MANFSNPSSIPRRRCRLVCQVFCQALGRTAGAGKIFDLTAKPPHVDALVWLEDLKQAARGLHRPQAVQPSTVTASPHQLADAHNPWQNRPPAMRLFTDAEQARLGATGWRFVAFLAAIGALPQDRLELVMERTMAASGDPISMEDLKLIVLMVFWSLGEEPDALVFDELCDNRIDRLAN